MKPTDTSSRLTGLPAAFFWGQKNQKPLAVRLADHKFKPQAPKMEKLAFYLGSQSALSQLHSQAVFVTFCSGKK